tara:strand:+ start:51 stop:215 length:165 start_codon:yes stop_codon:yes gene_type:complete
MGTAELREKIIQLLNTDDQRYLEDVFDITENKRLETGDPFFELPTESQEIFKKV